MKKFLMILSIFLFSFSIVGGGILLTFDLPSIVSEESGGGNSEDGELNSNASGYWSSSSYYSLSFAGGDGTGSNPYKIATAAQLAGLAYRSNSSSYYSTYNSLYYELVADIDLSAHYWVPIGRNYAFTGSFNGNHHVISGMTCKLNSGSDSYYTNNADSNGKSISCALFGTFAGDSTFIQSFALKDMSITTYSGTATSGKYYKFAGVVAAVLGPSDSTSFITGVNVFGTIRSSITTGAAEIRLGSVAAYMRNGYIGSCQSYASLYTASGGASGSDDSVAYCTGGIVGRTEDSMVVDCAMLGYIDSYLVTGGGIVGCASSTDIQTSYAIRGSSSTSSSSNYFWFGTRDAGGIVGCLKDSSTVRSCWASVGIRVKGSYTNYKGAIVGYSFSGCKIYCTQYNAALLNCTKTYNNSATTSGNGHCSSANSSYYRRSNAFISRMTMDSNGVNWYNWNINGYNTRHLNYGFPVVDNSYAYCSAYGNENTKNIEIHSIGTGVDENYSSSISEYGSVYSLIGGEIRIIGTGNENCYFRSLLNRDGELETATENYNQYIAYTTCSAYTTSYSLNSVYYMIFAAPTTDYWQNSYASSFAGGSGTSSSPYLISNGAQLARMAYLVNGSSYSSYNADYFRLTTDIDLSGKIWTPIGLVHNFAGNFDGNGYTINGLTCTMYSSDDPIYGFDAYSSSYFGMGLFGYLYGADVYDFVLTNVDIGNNTEYGNMISSPSSYLCVGGVCAYARGSSSTSKTVISQVGAFGSVNCAFYDFNSIQYIGGIVGRMYYYTTLEKSFNYASVTSGYTEGSTSYGYVGGLVGYAYGSSSSRNVITDCYNCGSVSNYGYRVGGIAGYTYNTNIIRCYNDASVRSFYYGGGLVGYANSSTYIYNSFAEGEVSRLIATAYGEMVYNDSTSLRGGLFGYSYGTSVNLNYVSYRSSDNSKPAGTGSYTSSNLTSYSSDSTVQSTSRALYTSGSYPWSKTTSISSKSYTWIIPTSTYSYLNNRYPILSWSVRSRSTSSEFSECGTTTIALRGAGASATTASSSRYAILGMGLTISASAPSNPYGVFAGICEQTLSSNFASTAQTYSTYCKGGVSKYIGVYKTTSTDQIYIKVVAYTPYDKAVNMPTSTTTAGSVKLTKYTTGDPWNTSQSSTSETYSISNTIYKFRTATFTAKVTNSAWKFKGWYATPNSTITSSDIEGAAGGVSLLYSTNLSVSWEPVMQTMYVYAVFEPNSTTGYFDGAWVSTNNGSSYSRKTTSGSPYSYVSSVLPIYSNINNSTKTTKYSYNSTSTQTIPYVINKSFSLTASPGSYYIFNGWYYYSSPITSSNISSATLLTTSTSYSSNSPPLSGKYFFAKFTRKVVNVNFYLRTSFDGMTYDAVNPSSTDGSVCVEPKIAYYNTSNTYTTLNMKDAVTGSISVQAGTIVTITPNPGGNFVFKGFTTSSGGPSTSTSTPATTFTAGSSNVTYYLYFCQNSGNKLKYDSTDKYWYFEDGEFPQSYVGTSMNNTLTNNMSNMTSAGSIKYNNGNSNVSIPIYSYSGKKYARLQATSTQTLKMSDGTSYTFNSGTYYWFEVEPIRWRVSDYGVSSASYPSGWSAYGSYNQSFTVVSEKVLGFGAVTAGNTTENWSFTASDMFKNVNDAYNVIGLDYNSNYLDLNVFNQTINGVTVSYNSETNRLTLNGTLTSSATLDTLPVTFNEGEAIRISRKLISGSATGGGCFVLDVKKSDGSNVSTRCYADFSHSATGELAKTIKINNSAESEGHHLSFWLWTGNDTAPTFNNAVYEITFEKYEIFDKFGDKGQQDKVSQENLNSNGLRVASIEELSYLSDKTAEASDLVCFLQGVNSGKVSYWTRNLGAGLNNGQVITKAGIEKSMWLNTPLGIRFALTMKDGVRT